MVEVRAWSPKEANDGLRKWLEVVGQRGSSKFQLHIGEESTLWGKVDDSTFTTDSWNDLWLTMSENKLLPCEYEDKKG